MKWQDFRSSNNVEDRRGSSLPGGRGGLSLGTIIVLALIAWLFGVDPRLLIGGAERLAEKDNRQQVQQSDPRDQAGQFAKAVLGNIEDVWKDVFSKQLGRDYRSPKMVLFSGATRSGCGLAQSAMGPFYCPVDETVYIDLTFFDDMKRHFGAGGDFAYAYVIAHEVGHHVEKQLGLLDAAQQQQRRMSKTEANQISVRIELMADCLAGVWAYHSNLRYQSLETGDIEKAVAAAAAIGDDRLQRQSQGYAVPDSFTHGSSEQRVNWLKQGLKSGQVRSCDTFQ